MIVMAAAAPSAVFALSDRYVTEAAALDPIMATSRGVAGHDDRLTDYSPDGSEARAEHARHTLAELSTLEAGTDADRRAAAVLTERLESAQAMHDAGEHLRALRVLASPVGAIRQVFDLMATTTPDELDVVATRMEAVPAALAGVRAALEEGLRRQLPAAQRQVDACVDQCRTWSGADGTGGFFRALADRIRTNEASAALQHRIDAAAAGASDGYAELGHWLRDGYGPGATGGDGVGLDRYRLWARSSLGSDLDPHETYAWGWQELHRIEAEMAEVAQEIVPGGSVADAKAILESDDGRAIEGEDGLRQFLQDLMDRTIIDLDGTHFDIPEPVRRVEAMIAPPGGAAAMYYTGPSEDFTRPGRTWYPTLGKTRFPLWGEVSICYHEGVPGHHLQVAQVRYLQEELSRFQRLTFVPGHGEGWALYAERLMDELGYLDNPDYRLGYLRAQCMRAVRVVVDIGLHLGLDIVDDDAFHPGERWTPNLGREFVITRSHFPEDFMASEIIRYLGWPAQAISYKVGERVWLAGRADAEVRRGDRFDLKAFHRYALDLGPMGLDLLRDELQAY